MLLPKISSWTCCISETVVTAKPWFLSVGTATKPQADKQARPRLMSGIMFDPLELGRPARRLRARRTHSMTRNCSSLHQLARPGSTNMLHVGVGRPLTLMELMRSGERR